MGMGDGPGSTFMPTTEKVPSEDVSPTAKRSAQLLHADPQRIVLGDLIPQQGRLVLSFHYQAGMRVTPSRIQLEKDDEKIPQRAYVREVRNPEDVSETQNLETL